MRQGSAAAAVLTSVVLFFVSVSGCRAKKNCAQSSMGPSDLYSNGVMNPHYMWYRVRNKIQVPVVIDPDYNYKERSTILGGLGEIQHKTCIDFYIFNDTHVLDGYDYVYITKAKTGCWSHIGRVGGGAQELSLGKGCVNHRTAVHEMIHALGFAHEHVRSDRDTYVYVFWQNISPGRESNFAKRNTKSTDPYGPYGTPYTSVLTHAEKYYASIMHYDRRAFSHNKMDTLKPLKPGAEIGVGQTMSSWDVKKLRRMYDCGGHGSGYGGGGRGGGRGHRHHSSSSFAEDNKLGDLDLEHESGDGQPDFHEHEDDIQENEVTSYQPRRFQENGDTSYQPRGFQENAVTPYKPRRFQENGDTSYQPRGFQENAVTPYKPRRFQENGDTSYQPRGYQENAVTPYKPRGFQERDPYLQGYHHRTLTFDEDRASTPQQDPPYHPQPQSYSNSHQLYNHPNLQELATPFFDNFDIFG